MSLLEFKSTYFNPTSNLWLKSFFYSCFKCMNTGLLCLLRFVFEFNWFLQHVSFFLVSSSMSRYSRPWFNAFLVTVSFFFVKIWFYDDFDLFFDEIVCNLCASCVVSNNTIISKNFQQLNVKYSNNLPACHLQDANCNTPCVCSDETSNKFLLSNWQVTTLHANCVKRCIN